MLSHFRSSMLLISFSISIYLLTVSSKQFYDPTPCSSPRLFRGSLHTCNSSLVTCGTYIVYRSKPRFETISEISALFGIDPKKVLFLNNLRDESETLRRDTDVLIPIQCSCSNGFFRSNTNYSLPATATLATVSCDTYEGLVKLPTLVQENTVGAGKSLVVPLRCACVDTNDVIDGFNMLLTYPIVEYDTIILVAARFGIPPSDVWLQNSLGPYPTIYPNTTILVPLRSQPRLNSSIRDPHPQADAFIPLSPTQIIKSNSNLHKHMYAIIGFGIGLLLILLSFGMCFFCRAKHKAWNGNKLRILSFRSSTISCLSPDILAVIMSKYSLISYSTKELIDATQGFSEDSKLGAAVYKGCLGDSIEIVIKQMSFIDARRTIGIYSRINHSSIVKLEGVCYGEDELSPSYLVFEFAQKRSLRDCLLELPWHRRVRIAFDVAIGLYYIHHCTVPSYIHMNINSRNILVTEDWRAKIANLGIGSVISISSKERSDVVMTAEGWIAPEYLYRGLVSAKVDVFAFGVVLLELLSAKQAKDRSFVTDNLGFLSETECANGCFNELRDFVDPNLMDFPIADALCLSVLSKACVEDEPLRRPSMDDILKVLARMER